MTTALRNSEIHDIRAKDIVVSKWVTTLHHTEVPNSNSEEIYAIGATLPIHSMGLQPSDPTGRKLLTLKGD